VRFVFHSTRPLFNLKHSLIAAVFTFTLQSAAHADEIVVCAAASLTNAFKAIGEAYERESIQARKS
jgi:molybdate transport system substrate-binding protein